MTGLDDILRQCPVSDAQQLELLKVKYRLSSLEDLQGAVVFGAAKLGAQIALRLEGRGVGICGFSDNDPERWNSNHCDWPVIPPRELDRRTPVIIASKFVKNIYASLLEQGARQLIPHYILPIVFPKDFPPGFHCLSADAVRSGEKYIREAFSLLSDEQSRDLYLSLLRFRITLEPADLPDPTPGQYFPGDFWLLSPQEVFVDVGAFTGDTMISFLQHTGGVFSKYYALEPDPENLDELKKVIPAGLSGRILALPYGAGERRHRALFVPHAGGESRISQDGSLSIEIISLDELLASEAVSTIKIDVEGYEEEVLNGARNIVGGKGPKLAVSVYHKLRDLWEIPVWIRECNGGYRFYLRHHTEEIYDTILYCVPDRNPGTGNCETTSHDEPNLSTVPKAGLIPGERESKPEGCP